MVEVKPAYRVIATQKGATYASRDAVVIRCVIQRHQTFSGLWHKVSLELTGVFW